MMFCDVMLYDKVIVSITTSVVKNVSDHIFVFPTDLPILSYIG